MSDCTKSKQLKNSFLFCMSSVENSAEFCTSTARKFEPAVINMSTVRYLIPNYNMKIISNRAVLSINA